MLLQNLKSANWSRLVLTSLFAVAMTSPAIAVEPSAAYDTLLTGEQWKTFNANLISAVHDESEGVREGALVQIVNYGAYMTFPEMTVFEVMRIYRDHKDPKIRRLAIVALGNMGSRWAIEFLDMLAPYEQNESLRKTMESVVRTNRTQA